MTFATSQDLEGTPRIVKKNGVSYYTEEFVIDTPGGKVEKRFYCRTDNETPRNTLWIKATNFCERHDCHLHGRVWSTDDWKAHYAEKDRTPSVRALVSNHDVPTPFG